MKVGLFIPCYIDQFYPQVGFHTIKVLEKVGCEVHYNKNQTCCGQPAYNAGYWDDATKVGEKFIGDFQGYEYIVAPSASCVQYARTHLSNLMQDTIHVQDSKAIGGKVYEVSEFILKVLQLSRVPAHFNHKVTYHDACSALNGCGIKEGPRQLIQQVEGITLLEVENAEECCGFGGSFAVRHEAVSVAMAKHKVDAAVELGVEYIVSTDMSCLMQLHGYIEKQGAPIGVKHLSEVLAT